MFLIAALTTMLSHQQSPDLFIVALLVTMSSTPGWWQPGVDPVALLNKVHGPDKCNCLSLQMHSDFTAWASKICANILMLTLMQRIVSFNALQNRTL